MINWQSLAILATALCPGSLLLGFVGAVWLVRALGVHWPWEQGVRTESNPGPRIVPERPRPGDLLRFPRVQSEDVGKRTAEMAGYGWRFLSQDQVEGTKLFDLQFVWLGE